MCDEVNQGEPTLISLLDEHDDLPAIIITNDGPLYTRKQLRDKIKRVSSQLARYGVKRGDVVALSFGNDIELIICFLAICYLGATAAPLNSKYKSSEVEFYLSKLKSTDHIR